MTDFLELDPLQTLVNIIASNFRFALSFIAIFCVVHFVNRLVHYRLNVMGVIPRHPVGLIGIITAPFLHYDFNHLFFNCVPLFVLTMFMLTGGKAQFYNVTATIILVSGAIVWLVGRRGVHIGASGLIMGYWAFLLANAYYHVTVVTVLLAILSLYYFGGLFLALLPGKVTESWEGHVAGFIGGVIAMFLYGGVIVQA